MLFLTTSRKKHVTRNVSFITIYWFLRDYLAEWLVLFCWLLAASSISLLVCCLLSSVCWMVPCSKFVSWKECTKMTWISSAEAVIYWLCCNFELDLFEACVWSKHCIGRGVGWRNTLIPGVNWKSKSIYRLQLCRGLKNRRALLLA